MSAFKNLRDVCNNFEADLQELSTQLFSAKVDENFEESVAKKSTDLDLFRSKLRLLQPKTTPVNPELIEKARNERTTLQEYEDTATNKVLEQQVVKFLTESHAVKALITAPSSSLDPVLVERKQKIIDSLSEFRQNEYQVSHLETVLKERRGQLEEVQRQWDVELGEMRDSGDHSNGSMEVETGPLHRKLKTLVDKMEVMRWLISKLVTSRCGSYDWLSDPHRRLQALMNARHACTVEDILES